MNNEDRYFEMLNTEVQTRGTNLIVGRLRKKIRCPLHYYFFLYYY